MITVEQRDLLCRLEISIQYLDHATGLLQDWSDANKGHDEFCPCVVCAAQGDFQNTRANLELKARELRKLLP